MDENQIKVAKEYDFIIKEEPTEEENWYTNEVVDVHTNCSKCLDKDELINSLKIENKKLSEKTVEYKKQIQRMIFEHNEAIDRMNSLQKMELQDLKSKLHPVDSNHSIASQKPARNVNKRAKTENSENEYEVECLLKHKFEGKHEQYLVKWKGFDNRHNSWVDRKNLNCKALIDNYLKNNNLN